VDEEQGHIADRAYRRALALVEHGRATLDELADHLLEHEVLERAELERIISRPPPRLEERVAAARPLGP
jgi:ATP-dependent Zn protease